jgi:hypothetical protein
MKTIFLVSITVLQICVLNAQQAQQVVNPENMQLTQQLPAQPQRATQPQQQQSAVTPQAAQDRIDQGARVKMEVNQMKQMLSLTDSQSVKYEAIALKYAVQRDELMKKLKDLRKQQYDDIKQILTPEQLKLLATRQQQFEAPANGVKPAKPKAETPKAEK